VTEIPVSPSGRFSICSFATMHCAFHRRIVWLAITTSIPTCSLDGVICLELSLVEAGLYV
jgi:hypothetical protein